MSDSRAELVVKEGAGALLPVLQQLVKTFSGETTAQEQTEQRANRRPKYTSDQLYMGKGKNAKSSKAHSYCHVRE